MRTISRGGLSTRSLEHLRRHFQRKGFTRSHALLTTGGGLTPAMTDHLALFADYHATLPTGNFWQQTSARARYKF